MAKNDPKPAEELSEEAVTAAQVAATEAGRAGVVIDPPKAADEGQPVSVADQRAGGVASGDTVSVADQRAGKLTEDERAELDALRAAQAGKEDK